MTASPKAATTNGLVAFCETRADENGAAEERWPCGPVPLGFWLRTIEEVPRPWSVRDTGMNPAEVPLAKAASVAQTLLRRAACSSATLGIAALTMTIVTWRTRAPPRVRASMRYVPGPSCWPCTFPLKRTRFTPGWPRTTNLSATAQTGETCSTVNETGPDRANRNTRIVRRLDRGPLVEIQERDACSPDSDDRCDVRELLADDGPEAPAAPDGDDDPEPPASDEEGCEAEGVETPTEGDELVSMGVGSVGVCGSAAVVVGSATVVVGSATVVVGSGNAVVGSVTVGTVGIGSERPSARATPAETPSTPSTKARSADRINEITSNAPFRVRGPPKSPRSACGEG
jgi:hypothetical protein